MLRYLTQFNSFLFSLAIFYGLYWGWQHRDEYLFSAERGLGYAMGITGASLIVLLMLYPLRKKTRFMRGWLPIKYWFRMHMICGVMGPMLILFHCNFSLGARNANVALVSMLLVVASGLIGRFIYRHTHNGLYGKQLNYDELKQQQQELKQQLLDDELFDKSFLRQLEAIEEQMAPSASLKQNWRTMMKVNRMSVSMLKKMRVRAKRYGASDEQYMRLKALEQHLQQEVKVLRSMVQLSFYTQLFSIWHVVHIPFFLLLIITAIVHVYSVHLY